MANKRRSNNPLPNWQEKIAPDDQERWLPKKVAGNPATPVVRKRTTPVENQSGNVVENSTTNVENSSVRKRTETVENASSEKERMVPEPSRSHEIGDELNQGINRAFMLQCRARNEARRLYGNQPVNKRFVDAYAAQLLRKWL